MDCGHWRCDGNALHCVHATSNAAIPLQERNAAVIRAEGESESAKLISEATKAYGLGMIELRKIEAARDIADTLARSGNVVYLPPSNQILMNMPAGR